MNKKPEHKKMRVDGKINEYTFIREILPQEVINSLAYWGLKRGPKDNIEEDLNNVWPGLGTAYIKEPR